jgi:hypothetical protein
MRSRIAQLFSPKATPAPVPAVDVASVPTPALEPAVDVASVLEQGWVVRYDEHAKRYTAKHPKTGNVAEGATFEEALQVASQLYVPPR